MKAILNKLSLETDPLVWNTTMSNYLKDYKALMADLIGAVTQGVERSAQDLFCQLCVLKKTHSFLTLYHGVRNLNLGVCCFMFYSNVQL